MIHELVYRRSNSPRFHVRGYIEQGTTTTPFDMVVCNEMSRYHLAIEAMRRVTHAPASAEGLAVEMGKRLVEHAAYIREQGEDMPDIQNWKWTSDPA